MFSDVPANSPYFKWIQLMGGDNISAGCGGGHYCPGAYVIRGDTAIFIVRSAFNQLLPASQPVISSISPAMGPASQIVSVTITGQNTHFVDGTSAVAAGPDITPVFVTVNSATSLTADFFISHGATLGPQSIMVTTGSETAVLPNGFVIQ